MDRGAWWATVRRVTKGDDGDGGGDGDDLGNIGGVMILTDLASIQDLELSHLLPFYFCCISISFSLSN